MKKLVILLYFLFCPVMALAANDAVVKDKFNREIYSSQISKIKNYMGSFDTLESRFLQTVPERVSVSRGKIYISRPGKARLEYVDPESVLLLIKDGRMMYWDKDLDQVSYNDIPPTPFEALLYKDLDLSDDIKILKFYEDGESMSIVLAPSAMPGEEKKEHNEYESLTLVFSKNPFGLVRMQRSDENNATVSVNLLAPQFDKKIDDELFVFKNPRINKPKKRK